MVKFSEELNNRQKGALVQQNVGRIDRYARMAVGAVLVVVGTIGINNPVVGIIGLVVMGTGVFGFCGLYSLLGINTACKVKPTEEESRREEA